MIKKSLKAVCCAIVLMAALTQVSDAGENWPAFRGPAHNGYSDSGDVPVSWSETENIRWKTAIHGLGFSSPVIWENQIWMTTATEDGHKLFAVCVDFETGKIIHDKQLFEIETPQRKHPVNSYATPTPVVEDGRVYIHFGSDGTVCMDTASGDVLWTRDDLECLHWSGPGSSPFMYQHLLILHMEGKDFQYIIALDKNTGKTVWKTDRPKELYEKTIPLYRKGFTTPIIASIDGKDQLISVGAQSTHAYEPLTGKGIWYVYYGTDSSVSCPVTDGELVFINTGLQQPSPELWAVRPTGSGDVTESHVVWKIKENVPGESSPIVSNGLLYMVSDRGRVSCVDAKTGDIIWQENLRGQYSASPVYVTGRIYFSDTKGKTTVIAEGREYKVFSTNTLEEGFIASPAIKDNSMILRSKTHLYRIGK